MRNLEKIIEEPVEFWKLSLQGEQVEMASWDRAQWQSIQSLMHSKHRDGLLKILKKELQTFILAGPRNEEERIVLEKISRLFLPKSGAWFEESRPAPIPFSKKNSAIEGDLTRPHRQGGRYYNQPGERIWLQCLKTLCLLLPGTFGEVTRHKLQTWNRANWVTCSRSVHPCFTWIGHSTLLLQAGGFNLLFDPVFEFVKPCFMRHVKPGIEFEKLPLIDVVAISHNHADHFSPNAMERLKPYQPYIFAPKGMATWFQKREFAFAEEFDWWSQVELIREGRRLKLTAVPARHSSQLRLSDLNRSLWMGVVVEVEKKKFYFSGDTAFDAKLFTDIRKCFGPIDVAFLPITPNHERGSHLSTREALLAFGALGAKRMIPIHWGAYRVCSERIEAPQERLQHILETEVSFHHFRERVTFTKLGERVSL